MAFLMYQNRSLFLHLQPPLQPQPLLEPQSKLFDERVKSSSSKKFEFVFKSMSFEDEKIERSKTSKTSLDKSISTSISTFFYHIFYYATKVLFVHIFTCSNCLVKLRYTKLLGRIVYGKIKNFA